MESCSYATRPRGDPAGGTANIGSPAFSVSGPTRIVVVDDGGGAGGGASASSTSTTTTTMDGWMGSRIEKRRGGGAFGMGARRVARSHFVGHLRPPARPPAPPRPAPQSRVMDDTTALFKSQSLFASGWNTREVRLVEIAEKNNSRGCPAGPRGTGWMEYIGVSSR